MVAGTLNVSVGTTGSVWPGNLDQLNWKSNWEFWADRLNDYPKKIGSDPKEELPDFESRERASS